MNYKLAKKLYNAGFPQLKDGNGYFSCGCDDIRESGEPAKEVLNCGKKRYYKPTLSELIEACKKKIDTFCLWEAEYDDGTKEWEAGEKIFIDYEGYYIAKAQTGKTPEEAVAKLWLKLNK